MKTVFKSFLKYPLLPLRAALRIFKGLLSVLGFNRKIIVKTSTFYTIQTGISNIIPFTVFFLLPKKCQKIYEG
jgi:hypothetical protein